MGHPLQGSVQPERRGVGSIRYSIDGYYSGTVALGIFFLLRIQPHLVISKFPFPVIPAQSVGTLMQKVGMAVKTVLSTVSYSLWRRWTWLSKPSRRSKQISIFSWFDHRFYLRSKVLRAVPTGSHGYGAPCLLLAPNAYQLCRSHRKRKFVAKKVAAEYRIKRMPSAMVTYHHLSIDTSFYPPSFSSDTTFNRQNDFIVSSKLTTHSLYCRMLSLFYI